MDTPLITQHLQAKTFTKGVIAPSLIPFDEHNMVMMRAVGDQARRLSMIDGVLGIAVNTLTRERHSLSRPERLEVLRSTRRALSHDQLLLACIGSLSAEVEEEVEACCEAGADAIITLLPKWHERHRAAKPNEHLDRLKALADSLPLPAIAVISDGQRQRSGVVSEVAAIICQSPKIIGIDMGARDNVLHYDQAFYTLKTLDKPLACLPSSEAALFHNLNTGADGVISCLAYVAPHEVSALYRATKASLTHEAQALHNKLAPLIGLISGRDKTTREMVLRQIAHSRALLASTDARGLSETLDACTIHTIEETLDEIALTPIEWW